MVSYDYYHSSEVQPIEKGKVMTQYYSNTKKELVNINDMHHQHVWYAFKKLCDRLEELGICEHIWEDDYNVTTFKKKDFVSKDAYDLLWGKCEMYEENIKVLEKNVLDARFTPKATSNQVFKLEKEVSRLKQQIRDMYAKQSHSAPRYYFSNIPNTESGRDVVYKMRKWLNKDRYFMRVRGQYLDKSKLGKNETWRDYDDGQPLSKSRCIRVYIDQKREK